MRRGGTHSARARGKRSAGRHVIEWRAHAPTIALCALGAGILVATTYGLAHQPTLDASAGTTPAIAAAKDAPTAAASAIATTIKEQAAKKEDRLVTGSLPAKQEGTAPPATDSKAAPQTEKKKKPAAATAKAETPKTLFDLFQPKR